MQPVDEEPYEVGLDNHGCHDGPKTGRLRALDNVSAYFIKKKELCKTVKSDKTLYSNSLL